MKILHSFFIRLSPLLGIIGLTACSTQPSLPPFSRKDPARELAEKIDSSPRLSVLFVGNSYSFGVPKAFQQASASHGHTVRTGHVTFGGWTLAKHAENPSTLDKIRKGHWDIVVIQEHSKVPAMPPRKRDPLMFPPLRKLVTEVRHAGAIPILYQTWGRRDGDADRWGDDFYKMNARLRKGYQAAARNAGGIVIVPVGDAWEDEFRAGRGHALYQADGSHPSAAGDQITAETFCQVLFSSQGTERRTESR